MRDVLTAMIKAHEIQGVLALENSFNRVGLDHVLLVRVASTAVVTAHAGRHARADHQRSVERLDRRRRAAHLPPRPEHRLAQELGGGRCDQPRRAPCAVRADRRDGLSVGAERRKTWGFQDVLFTGKPLSLAAAVRQLRDGERAVQDLLPGGVPCADRRGSGHDAASRRCRIGSGDIERIVIETQEPGVRIIDKTGPLANPADRDHCIQYMVAMPLMFGRLTAADYEDEIAADPRVDALRAKMEVRENPRFTQEYYDRRQALHRQRRAGFLP